MLRAVPTMDIGVGVIGRGLVAVTAAALMALVGACDGAEQATPEPEAPPAKPKAVAPAPTAPPAPPAEPTPEPAPRPKTLASMEEALAKAAEIHMEHRTTAFCGCRYAASGRVSPASCGYKTRADEKLAKYVQWAHVVPPKDFGAGRECWTQPLCSAPDGSKFRGIECCQQVDPEFAAMRADLHNIVPFVGEVATDRSNYAFGDVEGEPRLYGSCDLEIDRDLGRVEPPPEVRGDVARVYFYMAEAYPGALTLTMDQLAQLKGWAAEDPPDEWEATRARAVGAVQGMSPSWLGDGASAAPAPAGEPTPADPAVKTDAKPAPADAKPAPGKTVAAEVKPGAAGSGAPPAVPGSTAEAKAVEGAAAG